MLGFADQRLGKVLSVDRCIGLFAVVFMVLGIYFLLPTAAEPCTNTCPVTAGLKLFDATGSRVVGVDWQGDETVLPNLPSNFVTPIDYTSGAAYMRMQVIEKSSNLKVSVIICVFANSQERCSYEPLEPAFMEFTETGDYYAQLGMPKDWENTLQGPYNWDAQPQEVYLQFVDEAKLQAILESGVDPRDYDQTTAAVLNWLYKPQDQLAQHLPIKVHAEVYLTAPDTTFVPPETWECPAAVCEVSTPTPPPPTPTPTPTPPTPTPTPTPPTPTPPSTGGKPSDLNQDTKIDFLDLTLLMKNWKKTEATKAMGDLDDSGTIDVLDLSILISAWGQ